MYDKIRKFFSISSEVLPGFWQTALKRNQISLVVICIMIFGMELFNMARVLFWSPSGLSTLNNRIYFTFYLSLFLVAAAYMVLEIVMHNARTRVILGIQYAAVLFFLLLHVGINVYDLIGDSTADIGIYYTAVLGLSVFILMPAPYTCILYSVAYAIFIGLAGTLLSTGDIINITFTTIVAVAVSLTSCHHHATIISQQQEINKINLQLRDIAQRDSLTNLLNKTAFQHCVEANLQVEGTTLLIADLDNFKGINDQYGHPCGDYVLKEVSLQIGGIFSSDAFGISRIGGDEFGILVRDLTEERLNELVQKLIQKISAITWHGNSLGVGCSFGGCRIVHASATYDQLYSEADRALYRAKNRGKNQFCLSLLLSNPVTSQSS